MSEEKPVTARYRGSKHGPITRLIDPATLGEQLKPFIFLDFFNAPVQRGFSFGMHPHSGIATLTWQPDSDIAYQDSIGQSGVLPAGGIECLQAGGGVWHQAKFETDGWASGFQLWVALPPEAEEAAALAHYVAPRQVPLAQVPGGELRLLLGQLSLPSQRLRSVIDTQQDMNYLVVNLQPRANWRYDVPAQHDVCWAFPFAGNILLDGVAESLELLSFGAGQSVNFQAGAAGARIVVGSAKRHSHDLVIGNGSVHTNAMSLAASHQRIREIGKLLLQQGRR